AYLCPKKWKKGAYVDRSPARYHGCLAPRSSIRDLIVPAPPAPDEPALPKKRCQTNPDTPGSPHA
ncbi:MAG: hypothetical protein ABIJ09_25895, partial [Pseudomonadota bacterium]